MKKPATQQRRPGFRYEDVWRIVRKIPRGKVATYGQIAKLAGLPRHARFIGYALHALPPGFPVPWHRVINGRGEISFAVGSSAFRRQKSLLEKEGVRFAEEKINLKQWQWKPLPRRTQP